MTKPPAELWGAVVTAREALARQRQQPQRTSDPEARAALLDALEAYVESLEERGLPIPYAIRDELRIQRLTSPPGQKAYRAQARGNTREY